MLVYIAQEICTYRFAWWVYKDSNITNAIYLTGLFVLYLSTMWYTFYQMRKLDIHLRVEEKAILQ